jgi:hypothetical protein
MAINTISETGQLKDRDFFLIFLGFWGIQYQGAGIGEGHLAVLSDGRRWTGKRAGKNKRTRGN